MEQKFRKVIFGKISIKVALLIFNLFYLFFKFEEGRRIF